MNPQRKQKLEQLLVDTAVLISRIHDELGSWEYVEGFLVGAVAHHVRNTDGLDEFEAMTDEQLESEILESAILASELAGRRHCND